MEKISRRGKVYGKKTKAAPLSEIFTRDATPPNSESTIKQDPPLSRPALQDLTNATINSKLDKNHVENADRKPRAKQKSIKKGSPPPSIEESSSVDQLAAAFVNVTIEKVTTGDVSRPLANRQKKARSPPNFQHRSSRPTRAVTSTTTSASKSDPRLQWLTPLTSVYPPAGHPPMSILTWHDILDPVWSLTKIAESSYAEVYKVRNHFGTSILKIMALRPPSGPGSQRPTAVTVHSVVSEVLIMDLMAEIPGFLEFKAAHVIAGRPPRAVVDAFDIFAASSEEGSFFPRPGAYAKEQLFVALELGDAGTDVEHFHIVEVAQLWDIFLRTVLALANGEAEFGFEHRDLHEGNVCVKQASPSLPLPTASPHRLGYSGLEITLLDYTLSRAQSIGSTNTNAILHRDLETDLDLFAESTTPQRQIYRRMRTYALFRAHSTTHPLFDHPYHHSYPAAATPWAAHIPYTNVLWLSFLLTTITALFRGDDTVALRSFEHETAELRARIDPDRRIEDAGFESAAEVLEFCLAEGWVRGEDLM